MSIPLLEYPLASQNSRVDVGFDLLGDEQPMVYDTETLLDPGEIEDLIKAGYRQICNEQQAIDNFRQPFLESQLRQGQITVKEFVRGLVLSENFRRFTYDSSNNYRVVEICFERVLGRKVFNDREKYAWSIVLATKGLKGFIDELQNTDEYQENFGEHILPYQRRRITPQREAGEITFAHTPRYDNSLQSSTASNIRYGYQGDSLDFSGIGVYRTQLLVVAGILSLLVGSVIALTLFGLI
jgi:phycobilisome rod-core linker protein